MDGPNGRRSEIGCDKKLPFRFFSLIFADFFYKVVSISIIRSMKSPENNRNFPPTASKDFFPPTKVKKLYQKMQVIQWIIKAVHWDV